MLDPAFLRILRPYARVRERREGATARPLAPEPALRRYTPIRPDAASPFKTGVPLPPLAGEGAEGGWGRTSGAEGCPHPAPRATFSRKREKGYSVRLPHDPPSVRPSAGKAGRGDGTSARARARITAMHADSARCRIAIQNRCSPSPACGGRCRRRMGARRRREERPHPALRAAFSRRRGKKGRPVRLAAERHARRSRQEGNRREGGRPGRAAGRRTTALGADTASGCRHSGHGAGRQPARRRAQRLAARRTNGSRA